ncbi:MAG: NUDIX domain-containing protein, partial [Verrucomicrobia bacterium]|nr:NUDIX domain-containing protein [Verrucomicrobiota bacterium]
RPGETTLRAAERRLGEELGATTKLRFGFRAHYRAAFANGLEENEIVYIFFGVVPKTLRPHPAEVAAVAFRDFAALKRDATRNPEHYVFWLHHYLARHDREIRAGLRGVW